MDKLSAHSFEVVGPVLLEVLGTAGRTALSGRSHRSR